VTGGGENGSSFHTDERGDRRFDLSGKVDARMPKALEILQKGCTCPGGEGAEKRGQGGGVRAAEDERGQAVCGEKKTCC